MDRAVTFRSPLWLRGGHAQTLLAYLWGGDGHAERAEQHRVALPDGDTIVLHDDQPEGWRAAGPVALLIHGLAGCHRSPYMKRIAAKLVARGVRTFRMDLRGCGAGLGLARFPYHSGRSEDAAAALKRIEQICPGSPVGLAGFSLGGNIVLKLAGECGDQPPANLAGVAAASPPVDLLTCVESLRRPPNHWYDRYFVRLLLKQLEERVRRTPGTPPPMFPRRPTSLFEFDDGYTGPVAGFGDARTYYRRCSSAPLLGRIRIPTLILTARDDPMVPIGPFENAARSGQVHLMITHGGGHLGFIARRSADADRRWMDWRIVDWILRHTE